MVNILAIYCGDIFLFDGPSVAFAQKQKERSLHSTVDRQKAFCIGTYFQLRNKTIAELAPISNFLATSPRPASLICKSFKA